MTTPSPAPGLEECVEWLDSLRITDITWSANEFERIREIVHATKHHLQSLRPAQPAPTVQRWNPGVTWLNDRAAEPEMFESDIGTFVRWIDHVAALRAASAASATYTQEQLDAAKWRAHELLRGLTLDPPRACPCCANQPPASGLSEVRFAWLIERQIDGRAAWRSMTSFKPEAGWTHDANEAMQFSREKGAIDFMAADCGDGEIYVATATEHGFHSLSTRLGKGT
jgi:hypothetical protein